MKTIDARGLACPAPVLKTRAELEENPVADISVIVDNAAASQNVSRFLESQQFTADIAAQGDDFVVSATRSGGAVVAAASRQDKAPEAKSADTRVLVMIACDRMGRGDDDLGAGLMVNFIKTLPELGRELWRLVFVNSGVRLTIDGSAALEDLQALEAAGVSILVCGTCLTHFDLLERKQIGETTNMLDIVTSLQLADRVINM
jgi:selenium metabolism protein YedF